MSVFDLSIKPTPSPCASTDYLFYIATPAQAAKEGESVSLTVVGGIGPYDWVSLSPGVSILTAQTTLLTNTLTVNALPWGGYAYYKVTDSCGTERIGAVGLWDDYSFDCHSAACEGASELTFTGPTVDVTTGSQYTASGGVPPYRYRVTHGSIDGTGQVVGFYDLAGDTYQITVTVIDMCGKRKSIEATRLLPAINILDGWIAAVGETVTFQAYGCDDDMRFSINCGEIDKRTGEILSLDGCECVSDITVTGSDACGQSDDSSVVNAGYVPLVLSGPEEPLVGSIYTASGGISPYSYSFDGGTIDDTGKITLIASCGGTSGNSAVGSITVTDACGQSESIEVRLPGGTWNFVLREFMGCSSCVEEDPDYVLYLKDQCPDFQTTQYVESNSVYAHYENGSYGIAEFAQGGTMRHEYCQYVENPSTELGRCLNAAKGGSITTNVAIILPKNGSPADSIVFDPSQVVLTIVDHFEWVCP